MSMRGVAVVAALAAAGSVFADTHNVADGATDTLSGVTETSRFTKTGGGTLVLSGDNSLDTVTVSAGTLNIHGGTTTISGSGQGSGNAARDVRGEQRERSAPRRGASPALQDQGFSCPEG